MDFGLTFAEAGSVIVSSVGVYVAFLVLFKLAGQRVLTSVSAFDLAATVALGAIMGRTVLGHTPTLLAGLLGICSLFLLQATFGFARRRNDALDRALSRRAILLMADGKVLQDNLSTAGLQEDDLRQRLRQASVRSFDEAAAVVLERTGAISVLRRGEPIGPEILADVYGHEILCPPDASPPDRET